LLLQQQYPAAAGADGLKWDWIKNGNSWHRSLSNTAITSKMLQPGLSPLEQICSISLRIAGLAIIIADSG
jgi:hypothetical protein